MSYPNPPEIATSYTAQEQALGDGSFPGQEIDVDLAAIQASITTLINFVKGITRSDGKLANGIVTQESLSSNLIIGLDTPAPWATATDYTTSSLVFEGFGLYLCISAHTSSDFATDLGSGRWQLLLDLTPPGGALIAANDLSDLADVGNARSNLGLGDMATANAGTGGTDFRTNSENDARFQQIAATLTSWIAITRASGFDAFVATPSSANLRALLTDEVGTGAAYFVGGALGTPASATLTNATGLPFAGLAAAAVVIESEGIASNDNDTTLPTSAAVKDYVDDLLAARGLELVETIATTSGTSITTTVPWEAGYDYFLNLEEVEHDAGVNRDFRYALYGATDAAYSSTFTDSNGINSDGRYGWVGVMEPGTSRKDFDVWMRSGNLGTAATSNVVASTGAFGAYVHWATAQVVTGARITLSGAGNFNKGAVRVYRRAV